MVEPANVRNYYIAGSQHGNASATTAAPSTCAQFGSGVDPNPALRVLFVALYLWVDGTAPPASAVPSTVAGTAVFANTGPFSGIGIGTVPQAALGFPTIPKALYPGLITVRNQFNLRPQFDAGILTIYPTVPTGKYYPNSVSKVDIDGNDIAGIRLPDKVAPMATDTGWNRRSAAFAHGMVWRLPWPGGGAHSGDQRAQGVASAAAGGCGRVYQEGSAAHLHRRQPDLQRLHLVTGRAGKLAQKERSKERSFRSQRALQEAQGIFAMTLSISLAV